MKWYISFILIICGIHTAHAQDVMDEQIDVERAIVDTDAAQTDAIEAKKNAKLERERKAKLKEEARASLQKAKQQEAQAKSTQKQAEAEIARLTAENNRYMKDIKIANERQTKANKEIQASKDKVEKMKQQHDDILRRKKDAERSTEDTMAQNRDIQRQEREAVNATNMAAKELSETRAREKQALLDLQRRQIEAKKRIEAANARTNKINAEILRTRAAARQKK